MGEGGKKRKTFMILTVQRHWLKKRLRPNQRMKVKYIPFPDTYHPLTKDLLTAIPFTKYITSSYQKKLQGVLKRGKIRRQSKYQTQTWPGVLDISDPEFKATIIK